MKTPKSLYSRLALITSVTLVVGYFVVYAAWTSISDVTGGQTLTATLINNILGNLTDLNGRTTTLEGAIAGASVWSKVGSDINYTAGNVGIGTATSPTKLSLYDGTTGPIASFQGLTTNYRGIKIADTANSENWFLGTNNLSKFVIRRAGTTDDMTISSAGNIGIGTVNPAAKLDVTGNINFYSSDGTTTATKIYRPITAYADQAFDHASLYLGGSDNGYGLAMGIRNDNKVWLQAMVNNAAAGAGPILLAPDGGNVGIGTTSPVSRLQVNGGNTYITNSVARLGLQDTQTSGATYELTSGWSAAGNFDIIKSGVASRMTIDTNGNVTVGKIAPDVITTGVGIYPNGGVYITNPTTSIGGEFMIFNNNIAGTHTNTALNFRRNNISVGSITFTNAATQYNTTSDYRLKENIVNLTGALNRIYELPVHRFNYISNPHLTMDGFLAHEVQAVVPEAVTGEKDAVDSDGKPVYQQVDYSKVVPLLTAGIRELKDQNDTLRTENTEMKARLDRIESLLK